MVMVSMDDLERGVQDGGGRAQQAPLGYLGPFSATFDCLPPRLVCAH